MRVEVLAMVVKTPFNGSMRRSSAVDGWSRRWMTAPMFQGAPPRNTAVTHAITTAAAPVSNTSTAMRTPLGKRCQAGRLTQRAPTLSSAVMAASTPGMPTNHRPNDGRNPQPSGGKKSANAALNEAQTAAVASATQKRSRVRWAKKDLNRWPHSMAWCTAGNRSP